MSDEDNTPLQNLANLVTGVEPQANTLATVEALPTEVIDRPIFYASLSRAHAVADSFDHVLARLRAQVDEFRQLNADLHAETGGK